MINKKEQRPRPWLVNNALLTDESIEAADRTALLGKIKLMQQICDSVRDRISLVDVDGYFVYTVNSVAKVYGIGLQDIIGRHQSEVFSEESYKSHIEPAFNSALLGNEVVETALLQYRGDTTQQNLTQIDFVVSPWRDNSGNIVGVSYRVLDNERYLLYEEQRLTRQQLMDFLEASSDWRWEMDQNLCLSWISNRFEELYDIKSADYVGEKPRQSGNDPQQRGRWDNHLQTLASQESFRNFDFQVGARDNSWGRISGVPIYNAKGEFDGYRGVGTDISDLKRLEIESEQVRSRFMRAIDHYPGGFLLIDSSKNIIAYNMWYQEYIESFGISISTDLAIESIVHELAYTGLLEDATGREELWIAEVMEEFTTPGQPQDLRRGDAWLRREYHHLPDGSCLFTLIDVTRSRELEQKLTFQASHDALTKLVNRTGFEEQLELLVTDEQNYSAGWFVGYLDLDRFKIVNDTVGHGAGDQLLFHVAKIIKKTMQDEDLLARLGGDEFGLLLQRDTTDELQKLCDLINKRLEEFLFEWDSRVFSVSASIGMVEITAERNQVASLLSCADIACYNAKDLGRCQLHIYESSDTEQFQKYNELLHASGIKEALEHSRFVLYAQPIASIAEDSLDLCHYEILVRMLDEQGSLILPGAFIPAAERFGIMNLVDRWVIKNALQKQAQLKIQGKNISITINLSGQSLTDKTLTSFVKEQLQDSGVAPSRVCFELTETAAISNLENADLFIRCAKELGCSFALDDFGSGLSSFGYIKHFPVDYLKIDGGFVKDMINDPTDKVMVSAINQMAHVLGMQTIAEFVENDEILAELKTIGVDMVQGYGIGKPIPFNDEIADVLLTEPARKAA